jgi:putative transposase
MPRHARYVVPGIPLHIMQRGVNKQICFQDDLDRLLYVRLLEETSAREACAVHAFTLMPNHVHILATPDSDDSSGAMMKRVGQVYTQFYNRKYQRCGTLWGGRYKSCLVDTESYLMRCYRYIDLNAVRSRLVHRPEDYRWSSYEFNGLGRGSWIVPHELYEGLGKTTENRATRYRSFVAEGISLEELQAIRIATRGGFPLGSKEFCARLAAQGIGPHDAGLVSAVEKVVCPRF